jgi:polyhydroxyalkanoate synthesis regulator phasin
MTQPNGNGPAGPDDLAALAALDLALDELAVGDVAASPVEGEAAVLAAVAAELRAAVPPPPPGAAERGRAAFLARAAEPPWKAPASPVVGRRRRLPVRVLALAAALIVLAAVPAVARQARPGTALWPVRRAGQELRVNLADDPVRRAHLQLNTAQEYLAEAAQAGEERREDMADRAEDVIDEVLDQLEDVSGSRAAVERARAGRLLLAVRALEHADDQGSGSGSSGPGPGTSGSGSSGSSGQGGSSGSGSSGGDDHSGRGGGDDGGGDDGGGGSGSGSGGGMSGSGSGSGSPGSRAPEFNRSGSGDD